MKNTNMEVIRNIIIVSSVITVMSIGLLLPVLKKANVPKCFNAPNYRRLPYEFDCAYFYECNAGLMYRVKCPERTWFNSVTQSCTIDESVCGRVSEEKYENSQGIDDTTDIVDSNEKVTIVYKYIYVSEHPKRYKKGNSVTETDSDTYSEPDATRATDDNSNIFSSEESDTDTLSLTTTDSLEEDTETTPRYHIYRQTPAGKKRHKRIYENGKNKRHSKRKDAISRVYRNAADLSENADSDEDPGETLYDYKNELHKFVRKLEWSLIKQEEKDKRKNKYKKYKKRKATTEPSYYEGDELKEVTRAAMKKITTSMKAKVTKPRVRYVNFNTYTAPYYPYKIIGTFFYPSFINVSKLVKRSLATSSTKKHTLDKRNGFHIKLNLMNKKKSLTNHHLYHTTNHPLYDTYPTTPSLDSFDILKILTPSLEEKSLTSLENQRTRVNHVDLLKIFDWHQLTTKLNFIDNPINHFESKPSDNDRTEPSNIFKEKDDSSRQYIVIHYRRKKLPLQLKMFSDIKSIETDATTLTTIPTVISTSTTSTTPEAARYIKPFNHGSNFDFGKEMNKVLRLMERNSK